MEKQTENKNIPITQENKQNNAEIEKKEKKSEMKRMDFGIFLLLLIFAIIKDAIEIILGLIPGINLFVWIFSLPFTAFILFITIITGIRGAWMFAGYLIDLLPIASILPVTTLTVIFCYITQNAPKPLKKP